MMLHEIPQYRVANHAVDAWIQAVIPLLTAERDPKTVSSSARLAGIGVTTFKDRCRRVGVPAKKTVDQLRVLRACLLAGATGESVENLMDIADPRTRKRLLARLGLSKAQPATLSARVICELGAGLPPILLNALILATLDPAYRPRPLRDVIVQRS
jgi:hypothetical protein